MPCVTPALKPAFAALLLACAAFVPASHAQDAANLRLRVAGEFIGANQMMLALGARCPGDYGDGPYGARGALGKLKPVLDAAELAELEGYVHSREFAAVAQDTAAKVERAYANLAAKTGSAAGACTILARDILATYAATRDALGTLR